MMKSRKDTPDIMGNLMSGDVSVGTIKQENNKAIKQEASIGTATEDVKARETRKNHKEIKQENNKAGQESFKVSYKTIINVQKEKATFNLSLEVLQALEESWIKLRRKLKGEQRITKTLIVEKAIEIVLADFEAKNELSDLYIQLKN